MVLDGVGELVAPVPGVEEPARPNIIINKKVKSFVYIYILHMAIEFIVNAFQL